MDAKHESRMALQANAGTETTLQTLCGDEYKVSMVFNSEKVGVKKAFELLKGYEY